MESKIKEIEDLLATLEAAWQVYHEAMAYKSKNRVTDKISGVKAAIRILKEPSNEVDAIDSPIIRCAGCGCILNDPLCIDCGEYPPDCE